MIYQFTMATHLRSQKFHSDLLVKFILVIFITNFHQVTGLIRVDESCNPLHVDGNLTKILCVCNESSCKDLKLLDWPTIPHESILIESSEKGKRFQSRRLNEFMDGEDENYESKARIIVDPNSERQTLLGWGGAFTDAFGYNLLNLTGPLADKLIESYYGENGLQYNFGRVPIGGSDFSTRPYSYDDTEEPDFELKNWSLTEEDYLLKIPVIERAREHANNSGVQLKLFGSPWSAPKWMKTNGDFLPGSLIETDQAYRSWAKYLIKFYKAYEKLGIKFWGGTVQNEPITAIQRRYSINGMRFTSKQMSKFISNYLGPELTGHGYTKEKFKLMVGDDNLGFINMHLPKIMENNNVSRYVSGIAYHWYYSGGIPSLPYEAITEMYEPIKDKVEFLMMSEACNGWQRGDIRVDPGSWHRGEMYASDIMEDLKYGTSAWVDWNMALDMRGGPNWPGIFVDSSILVNAKKNEFYKQPMYYTLAHFSRFFTEGTVLVNTSVNGELQHTGSIWSVAALNKKTNHLTVNILNKSKVKTKIYLKIDGLEGCDDDEKNNEMIKSFIVDAKSINSFVIKL